MKCEFMVGDSAITTYDRDLVEKYRGLTCRIVDVDCFDGFVGVVFDEDPNGKPGRLYAVSTETLIRRCGDEPNCEAISEFLDEM